MSAVRDWGALRRPLRSCAIGTFALLLFFAAWQFLIPGKDSNPLAAVALIVALSVCLSSGVGLSVSATRRLWRSTRRSGAVLPALFLVGVVVALPSAAGAAGMHSIIVQGSILLSLLLSAAFSAYLIVSVEEAAPSPSPPAAVNDDDPDAYVSDIPANRKNG